MYHLASSSIPRCLYPDLSQKRIKNENDRIAIYKHQGKEEKSILHMKIFIFIAQIGITSSNTLLISIFTEERPT
jgi:hypothetical protein